MNGGTPASKLLRRAKSLICQRGYWTKHTMARDAGGSPVAPECLRATRFSVAGALYHVCRRGPKHEGRAFACLLAAAPDRQDLQSFNNAPNRTHAEVLAVYDSAIVKAYECEDMQSDDCLKAAAPTGAAAGVPAR